MPNILPGPSRCQGPFRTAGGKMEDKRKKILRGQTSPAISGPRLTSVPLPCALTLSHVDFHSAHPFLVTTNVPPSKTGGCSCGHVPRSRIMRCFKRQCQRGGNTREGPMINFDHSPSLVTPWQLSLLCTQPTPVSGMIGLLGKSPCYLHNAPEPIYSDDITSMNGTHDIPDTNDRRNMTFPQIP